MTTAGENNKALKEVALELAHEGGKDPVGCQGEGPRAGWGQADSLRLKRRPLREPPG